MMARVHVNAHTIRRNVREGRNDPAITVKRGRRNDYCHEVAFTGPVTLVSRFDKPLPCGARIWLECDADVVKIVR